MSRTEYLTEEIRTLQHLDRYDDADALLAGVRHEPPDDVDRVLPSLLFAQVWQDHNLARFDAAEAGARTLLRLAREIGNVDHEINARTVLAGVAIYRGDLPAARALVRSPNLGAETSELLRTRIRLVQGWLTGEEGDYPASLAILRPLVLAAASGLQGWAFSPPWMRAFVGIGLAAGDEEFTQAAVTIAELGAERNPGVATLVGTALQVRGVVGGDVRILARAVDVLRAAPRPLLLAQALADHATAMHRAGDAASAAAPEHEAVALFDALGAVPGALAGTKIRETLGSRRKRPAAAPRRPAHGLDALTETERRVADLTVAGHSSRSAAVELAVSPNTVNTHLRSIFAKLNVRSRVQLSNLLRGTPSVPAAVAVGPSAGSPYLRGSRDRRELESSTSPPSSTGRPVPASIQARSTRARSTQARSTQARPTQESATR
jgi:DNA-binding CsgD family transcriptional regulator